MIRPDIVEYFTAMTMVVSARATCPRRRVGCVIVDKNNNILSTGYNGVPRGMAHCIEQSCAGVNDNSDVGYDNCQAVHAEQNALLQCADVTKIDKIFVTTLPCITCAKLIANTSCKIVYYAEDHRKTNGKDFLNIAGISCVKVQLKGGW